jgi:hypothetical protein
MNVMCDVLLPNHTDHHVCQMIMPDVCGNIFKHMYGAAAVIHS